MSGFDLDAQSPEDVPDTLRYAAERFRASESELQAAWQDRRCGRVRREIAKILERAAEQCDKAIRKAE